MNKTIRTALVTGLPFGLIMGGFASLSTGWPLGMLLGIGAGVFFGGAMAVFVRAVAPKAPDHPVFAGETILHNGPANHFVGLESVGGWLYLTTGRLYFRSHSP